MSTAIYPRLLTMPEVVKGQEAIFNRTTARFGGQPEEITNWRNRIFVPYAMALIVRTTGISQSRAYLLVRWATASLALACFALLVTRATGASYWIGSAAALLHEITLLPTFFHIYEIPSDFTDSAVFSLLLLAALGRRRLTFTLWMFLGALNRESVVFGVIVWWSLHALGQRNRTHFLKESIWCLGWGLACTIFVYLVRTANGVVDGPSHASFLENFTNAKTITETNLLQIRQFISHPNYANPYFYLAAYLFLLVLLLGNEWPSVPNWGRHLILAAALIFLISTPTNHVAELRMFIPSLVLCNLVIVMIACAKLSLTNRRQVPGGLAP